MVFLKKAFGVGVLTLSGSVLAADFKTDCGKLVSALLQSNIEAAPLKRLREGPAEAFLSGEKKPWLGYFFPFQEGGVAARWQSAERGNYRLLSEDADGRLLPDARVREIVRGLSAEQLQVLSPTEKMDIYLGFYDFRITRRELEMRGPRRTNPPQAWEGFCNGRCAAGMLQEEPRQAVDVVNPDGIAVHFQPNDIKGLLSASYFYVQSYQQMGIPNVMDRVVMEGRPDAGAFDIAVRTLLGAKQRAFVIDIDPGKEIWNQLAVGYERKLSVLSDLPLPIPSMPEATHFVDVQLKLYYLRDLHGAQLYNGDTSALANKGGAGVASIHYIYRLYLDPTEAVVGGEWRTQRPPDFLWFPEGDGTDSLGGANPYLRFNELLALARRSTPRFHVP